MANLTCPKCLIGEIQSYKGQLRCCYCGNIFAPSTSRKRLDDWFDAEIKALNRRHAAPPAVEADAADVEFTDLPVEYKELDY